MVTNEHSHQEDIFFKIEAICSTRLTPISLSASNVVEIANASRSRIYKKSARILKVLSLSSLPAFHFVINKN